MRLNLRITPNAKASEAISWDGRLLKLRIAAPPTDEKANTEVVRFLAKKLRIAPSLITFIRGIHGQDKILDIPIAVELLKGKLGLE